MSTFKVHLERIDADLAILSKDERQKTIQKIINYYTAQKSRIVPTADPMDTDTGLKKLVEAVR